MTEDARRRLAHAQAALLAALLAGADPPPGFDPRRLRIEAAALLAKRRRVVERLLPDLADALGDRFTGLFDTWAAAHPRRDGTSARADAAAFAAWLGSEGQAPVPGATAAPRRARRPGRAGR